MRKWPVVSIGVCDVRVLSVCIAGGFNNKIIEDEGFNRVLSRNFFREHGRNTVKVFWSKRIWWSVYGVHRILHGMGQLIHSSSDCFDAESLCNRPLMLVKCSDADNIESCAHPYSGFLSLFLEFCSRMHFYVCQLRRTFRRHFFFVLFWRKQYKLKWRLNWWCTRHANKRLYCTAAIHFGHTQWISEAHFSKFKDTPVQQWTINVDIKRCTNQERYFYTKPHLLLPFSPY